MNRAGLTLRALAIGSMLGLAIAAGTYFNDHVIRQTHLISNQLPIVVFGGVVLLLLAINPLLGVIRRGWALRGGEVAVITALGLAVCAWPGSNLMRYFTSITAMPAYLINTQPGWQANEVFSYFPGGSARIAPGQVRDVRALREALLQDTPITAHIRKRLPGVPALARPADPWTEQHARELLQNLNDTLSNPSLYDSRAMAGLQLPLEAAALLDLSREAPLTDRQRRKLNRLILEAAFPGLIHPLPRGEGLLLNGGDYRDELHGELLTGRGDGLALNPGVVPWRAWWPTLRLWGGLALLLALASLCLALIVHPQWSKRELLPYPIVRFMQEIAQRPEGARLPAITRSRVFWTGFVLVLIYHLCNGLHAWFPGFPLHLPNRLEFGPLRQLFPTAAQVHHSRHLFQPTILLSVIAFGYFINTRAAMSLGLSLVFWVVLGSWLLAAGVPIHTGRFTIGGNGAALRFGAYLAATAVIFYYGRWYYLNVATSGLGLTARRPETPAYAVWAGRCLALCGVAAVMMLVRWAGLSVWLSVLLLLCVLMIFLVLSRINTETGCFYAQADFLPSMMLAGLLGVPGVGVQGLVVLTMASVVLVFAPREAVMPYLLNGIAMSDRIGAISPARIAPALGVVAAVGLVVAVVVTLTIQHHVGLDMSDVWASRQVPTQLVNSLSYELSDLAARGQLADVAGVGGFEALRHVEPSLPMLAYMLAGAGLFGAVAAARLRWPWWPLHPVLFLVWGTYAASIFALSFILSAVIKWGVVSTTGARGYDAVKPLMVGVIAAELLAAIGWAAAGALSYAVWGVVPGSYEILPR